MEWIRLQTNIFDFPTFQRLPDKAKVVYIFCLCQAGIEDKSGLLPADFDHSWIQKMCGGRTKTVTLSLQCLTDSHLLDTNPLRIPENVWTKYNPPNNRRSKKQRVERANDHDDDHVRTNERTNERTDGQAKKPNGAHAFDFQFKIPEVWEWYLDATKMADINLPLSQENKSAIVKILTLVGGSVMKAQFIIRGGLHDKWNKEQNRLDLPWLARDQGKMLNWLIEAKGQYPRKFEHEKGEKKCTDT